MTDPAARMEEQKMLADLIRMCISPTTAADAILASFTRSRASDPGWVACETALPDEEHVVELAVVSGYDGSLYRSFGCRTDTGEGWLWALGPNCTDDPQDCEADDDYQVYAWREPTPLPAAPPKGWNGSPHVIDPPPPAKKEGEA